MKQHKRNSIRKYLPTFALILSVPFVIMILMQVWVAMLSGTGFTIVYYNVFSEGWIEVVLFTIISIIIFIGLIFSFKKIDKTMR